MALDRYSASGGTAGASAASSSPDNAEEVVVDDMDVPLTNVSRFIYVGTGGHLVITTLGGSPVTLKNVASGTLIPIRAVSVNLGTTALDIVALD